MKPNTTDSIDTSEGLEAYEASEEGSEEASEEESAIWCFAAQRPCGYDPDEIPDLFATLRAIIFTPFLVTFRLTNLLVDVCTFEWVENPWLRVLQFPLHVLNAAIKLPLALLSAALGATLGLIGTLCCPLALPEQAPWWAPWAACFCEGLRPFAPQAATWIMGNLLVKYENMEQNQLGSISEETNAAWSWTYLIGLAASLLLVVDILIASTIMGDGATLAMVMPFVFKDTLGTPLLLSPALDPLAGFFGPTWLYLSGTLFVGGLSAFFTTIIRVFSDALVGKSQDNPKTPETLIPDIKEGQASPALTTPSPTLKKQSEEIPGQTQQGPPCHLNRPRSPLPERSYHLSK